jgi:Tfp pilus assembly protein PilE
VGVGRLRRDRKGVTLLEMMIASTLMLLVLGGLMSLFVTQTKAYKVQADIVDARSDLRTGMDFLERDIKNVSITDNTPVTAVCEATATHFVAHGYFTTDNELDKVVYDFVPGAGTTAFGLAPGTLFRSLYDGSANPGTLPDCAAAVVGIPEVLSDNVYALRFEYFDSTVEAANGTPLVPPGVQIVPPILNPTLLRSISRVKIRMDVVTTADSALDNATGRFVDIDPNPTRTSLARLLTMQSQVSLRNLIYQQ